MLDGSGAFREPVQVQMPGGGGGDGRVLRVDAKLAGVGPVSLVGVYAPTEPGLRAHFWQTTMPACLPQGGPPPIVGGDFNVVAGERDIVHPGGVGGAGGPAPHGSSRLVGSAAFLAFMQARDLRDVWRTSHPGEHAFTHWSPMHHSGARLDGWWASATLVGGGGAAVMAGGDAGEEAAGGGAGGRTATSHIMPTAGALATDHLPVSLTLHRGVGSALRGRGTRGFPLQILNVRGAAAELGRVAAEAAATVVGPTAWEFVRQWDDLKARLHCYGVNMYKDHQRKVQREAKAADRAAATAHGSVLSATDAGLPAAVQAWDEARRNAAGKWDVLLQPSVRAAATLDHMFADAPTYYFHALARLPHSPLTLATLRAPGTAGPPLDMSDRRSFGQGLALAEAFYSSDAEAGLFRPADVDVAAQDALLASVQRTLLPGVAGLAEGPDADGLLSSEELAYQLDRAARGSAPGGDGLPYEVYRALGGVLGPPLLRVFNAAFQHEDGGDGGPPSAAGGGGNPPPPPLARLLGGVITLVPKPGKARDWFGTLRPITLLNADAKLVMAILSNRLQRPLDYLIDIVQSAFLLDRDISDNIRYHQGLGARLRELGLPGWLLHSDLTGAYDRTSIGWLLRVMRFMGFRTDGIVRWCRIMAAGARYRVRLNGQFTASFPVTSGLPQGSALSCQLWVIVFEPCIAYLNTLQHAGRITALTMPSGRPAPAAMAHADDAKLPVIMPDDDGPVIVEAFKTMQRAGMPPQSIEKTVFVYLGEEGAPLPSTMDAGAPASPPAAGGGGGTLHHHAATGYRLRERGAGPHRLLGVPFGAAPGACSEAAYGSTPGAIVAAAQQWAGVRPTLLGRAHVAMASLASKVVFQLGFTPATDAQLQAVAAPMRRFVASGSAGRMQEEAPLPWRLYPGAPTCMLPPGRGGLALPDMEAMASALRAKTIWQLFSYRAHPWAELAAHALSRAPARAHAAGRGGGHPLPVPGPGWAVTSPAAEARAWAEELREIDAGMASAVRAFLDLGVTRIRPVADQDFHSVMREPTFHNRESGDLQPVSMATAAACTWARLHDVRAALLAGGGPTAAASMERRDLDTILAALPEPWRAHVQAESDPPPDWVLIQPAQGGRFPVFEGPDPMEPPHPPPAGEGGAGGAADTPPPVPLRLLWELWPSGVLVPLEHDAPPFVGPLPPPAAALVVTRPKPEARWTRDDYEYVLVRRTLPPAQRGPPLVEPHLLGVWPEMPVDPFVWGLPAATGGGAGGGATALADMTVKAARQRLTHLRTLREGVVRGYGDINAAWPAAWAADGPGAGAPPTPGSLEGMPAGDDLLRYGLPGHEARWRRRINRWLENEGAGDPHQRQDVDRGLPSWLARPHGEPPPLRPSPDDRRAARRARRGEEEGAGVDGQGGADGGGGGAGPSAALPGEAAAVWQRLADPCIHRPHRIVAWKVAHGTLGCNAFLTYVRCGVYPREVPLAAPYCTVPECAAGRAFETITHALLDCPRVRPVIQWLADTWLALAGGAAVPITPAVILADDLRAWVGAPEGAALAHWTRLRVAALGAIWELRCRRLPDAAFQGPGADTFARAAARMARDSVIDAIDRDWQRTHTDLRTLDAGGRWCQDWWRGFDTRMRVARFAGIWAEPATLCRLEGDPPRRGRPDERTLVVRLGSDDVGVDLPA